MAGSAISRRGGPARLFKVARSALSLHQGRKAASDAPVLERMKGLYRQFS
jgi:hypothetical protein